MPRRCSVFGCRSNYDGEDSTSTFILPKDPQRKELWLKSIPTDLSKIKNPIICAKHFSEDCILWKDILLYKGELKEYDRERPKLKENAIPTIFPSCPSYSSSSATKVGRLTDVENDNIQVAVNENLKTFRDYDTERLYPKLQSEVEPVLEFVGFDALEDNSPNNDSPLTPPELLNAQDIKQEVTEQADKLQLSAKENKPKAASKRKQTVETELQETLDQASTASRNDEEDECDLYGKLIAKKLRKLPESQRERMMYEIQGLFLKCSQYRYTP